MAAHSTTEPVDDERIAAAREQITHARRVVVKIGSNVLVGGSDEVINRDVFESLVDQLHALDSFPDRRLVLVTSGAIAVARRHLNESRHPQETLSRKQALAAVGQPRLMQLYAESFARRGRTTAQVLIAPENLNERERSLNARNTLRELATMEGIIPIVNENDTTSTDEIRFGDNDRLSALICPLAAADVLVILSDVDALYDADPRSNPDAKPIEVAWADDPALKALAEPADPNGPGSGGMGSKLRAAKVAGENGVPTVIASGRRPDILHEVLKGRAVGTLFVPRERLTAKKSWLRNASRVAGRLHVDAGAARALVQNGRSLLPSGITAVDEDFPAGSVVEIVDSSNTVIARGACTYASADLSRIAGRRSSEIESLLGYYSGDNAVHRDDMVLVDSVID